MTKIYINSNYEIKAINSTNDTSLTEIEIDRVEVFGDKSDFMILNYCYKQDENGYSIYPARNYNDILNEDYKIKIPVNDRDFFYFLFANLGFFGRFFFTE